MDSITRARCESGYCCERCGGDVKTFYTIDLAISYNRPDYYDICEKCFDKYIALIRPWIDASKGQDDDAEM